MKKAVLGLIFASAIFWVSVSYFGLTWSRRPTGLRLTVFDVGQGDATLIKTPSNEKILIDGGPDDVILAKLGQSLSFFDRKIDVVILTHPHADHLAGLIHVLQRYKVGKVYSTGVLHTTRDYIKWLELIRDRAIPAQLVKAGDKIPLSDLTLDVLFPVKDLLGKRVKNLNNTSVVLKFTYQGVAVLLAGDIEKEAEASLLDTGADLKADIFKVGHHGSKSSTTAGLISLVRPQIAIISVGGKNQYGHPSLNVIKRLQDFGAQVWRTDKQGDFVAKIGDAGWKIGR